jgi:hypothetical protein
MSDSFSLSGNLFGGYLFVSCDPTCDPKAGDPKDSPYVSTKLAMSYNPAPTGLPNLSLTLGYRVQLIINRTEADSGPGIDVTHGPIVGVNYRFGF